MSGTLIKKFKHYSIFKKQVPSFKLLEHKVALVKVNAINSKIKLTKDQLTNPKIKEAKKAEHRKNIKYYKEERQDLYNRYGQPRFYYEFVHHKTNASITSPKIGKVAVNVLHTKVKLRREEIKSYLNRDHIHERRRPFGSSTTLGLVHLVPGEISNLVISKKIHDLSLPKKPKDMCYYLGIEFEFTSKVERNELGLLLLNAGLAPFCELKTDGSLRPQEGENGYEIAMLVKESSYFQPLKKLCEIFQKINAQVEERRCGLHVHIDVRKRKKEIVYHNLVSCQSLLLKMIPNERRNGEFCAKVKSKKFPSNFTGERRERYKSINASSFYRHGTLEIRMHEGSVNFSDIRNWIILLVKIANAKTKLPKTVISIRQLKALFKVNEKVSIHVQDRINKWNILTPQPRRMRVPSFEASQPSSPGGRPAPLDSRVTYHMPIDTVLQSRSSFWNVESSPVADGVNPVPAPPSTRSLFQIDDYPDVAATDPDDIEN